MTDERSSGNVEQSSTTVNAARERNAPPETELLSREEVGAFEELVALTDAQRAALATLRAAVDWALAERAVARAMTEARRLNLKCEEEHANEGGVSRETSAQCEAAQDVAIAARQHADTLAATMAEKGYVDE
jgi:hypothetical protein